MTAATLRLGMPVSRIVVAHHNGPGLRAILWVQGCSLLCTKRCLNPHLLAAAGGFETAAAELLERLFDLQRNYDELEGITILGGEPFDQASALAGVLSAVRPRGLSTMVYTGHVFEELAGSAASGVDALLAATDVLVDGPFLDRLNDETLIWRGSANQRLLTLTDRYTRYDLEAAMARQRRAMYVSAAPHAAVVVAGPQTREAAGHLRRLAAPEARP